MIRAFNWLLQEAVHDPHRALLFVASVLALPASADVAIKQTITGKGLGMCSEDVLLRLEEEGS